MSEQMIPREHIIHLIQTKGNYSEVARETGLSRERVRQLAEKYHVKPLLKGYIPIADAAEKFGYARHSENFRRLVKLGLLPRYQFKNRWYVKVNGHELAPCLTCGKPIGKGRWSYCSQACLDEGCRQAHRRSVWRRLRIKQGQNIDTPALAFKDRKKQRIVRKNGSNRAESL